MAAAATRLLAEMEKARSELQERWAVLMFLDDRGDAEWRRAEQRLTNQHPFGVDAGERRKREEANYLKNMRAADERAAPLAEVAPAIARILAHGAHGLMTDGRGLTINFDAHPALEAWRAAREALRRDPDAPLPG
jgi:hypothetical protein